MKNLIKILSYIFVFILLLSSCNKEPEFDANLAGSYEILNAYDTSDIGYLTVTPLGLSTIDGFDVTASITQESKLKFDYENGTSRIYDYSYDKYLLLLTDQEGKQRTYINIEDFLKYNENETFVGTYLDETGTIFIDFLDNTSGQLLSTGDTPPIPFIYNAHDSHLRLEYDIDGEIQFEYLLYEKQDNSIKVKWPESSDKAVLHTADNDNELLGTYSLLYDALANDSIAFSGLIFADNKEAVADMVDCTYYTFGTGMLILTLPEHNMLFTYNKNELILELDTLTGDKYVFINESDFTSDLKEIEDLAGIYASYNLDTVLELNSDATGYLTVSNKKVDFRIKIAEGYMQITDSMTGERTYYTYAKSNGNIYIRTPGEDKETLLKRID